MRANRSKREHPDSHAQVGIGTMIVFIATVLVAAIAAGVLIDTSGKLQERSSRTGQEATDQVSSNLEVLSVVGRRDTSAQANLRDLDLFVTLAPGATSVDLNEVRLQVQLKDKLKTFNYSQASVPGVTEFIVTSVRDADTSFSASAPVMTAGDLMNVSLALDTSDVEFAPRAQVLLVLMPEVGSKIETGFVTPSTYGTKLVVELK